MSVGHPVTLHNTAMVKFIALDSANHYLSLQAKEMVEVSKSIANKIKDKQGDISEDEVSLKPLRGLVSEASVFHHVIGWDIWH